MIAAFIHNNAALNLSVLDILSEPEMNPFECGEYDKSQRGQ